MKWAWIIIAIFVFGYFLAPPIYRAMKKSDYKNLYNGMQDARVAGGSYHDETRHFDSYADQLIRGEHK